MGNNSYISRLFIILSILVSAIGIIMSMSIYNYSQKIISHEMINLNNAFLSQVSENPSRVIADSVALCNKIAYDSRLIEFLESPFNSSEKNIQRQEIISDYVKNVITNYIWSKSSPKNLLEAYIIGYNGINYNIDSHKYNINDLKTNPKYKESFLNNADAVLINTVRDKTETDIYRYAFQVVKEIRDNITQVACGFVILNISEIALCNSYSDLIRNDKKVMITDEDGIILSGKDKRLIGKKYLNLTRVVNRLTKESGYIKDNKGTTMIFFNRIEGTHWYLIEEMNLNAVLQPLKRIRVFILAATVIYIGIIFILLRHFANRTSKPIINIRNKMEQVTQGDLSVRASIKNNDEFGHIAKSFNEMVQQIEYLLTTIKNEERKKRVAELDFLRAQINPHFIYNTLSSIRFYIEMNKNAQAEEMLFRFSKILRNTFSRSDEFVTIRDEMETIKDYVQLQKLRYTDSFEVIYNISEDILDYMIPSFILQPIVENSIFYSVARQNTGLITIAGKCECDKIEISIADNGIGMSKAQVANAFNKEVQFNKVGLINVQERIELNYGMEYGLKIISEEGEGTQVIITLPIHRQKLIGVNTDVKDNDCG